MKGSAVRVRSPALRSPFYPGVSLKLAQGAVAIREEVERGPALVFCRDQLRVGELGALEPGGVPELPGDLGAPRSDVEIRLRVLVVAGRAAEVRPLGFRAELEGDVEVLGPELHRGGIAVGLHGAQLLEDRAGEAVEVAERARGGDVDVWEGLAGLLPAPLADELSVLHPYLTVGAVFLEEGSAEAAARVTKGDLVLRLAGGRDDRLRDLVERLPRLRE